MAQPSVEVFIIFILRCCGKLKFSEDLLQEHLLTKDKLDFTNFIYRFDAGLWLFDLLNFYLLILDIELPLLLLDSFFKRVDSP